MSLLLLEAGGALVLLLLIVWWTMFSGRRRGELPHEMTNTTDSGNDSKGPIEKS